MIADVAVIGGSGFYSFLDGPRSTGSRRRTALPRRRSPSAPSPAAGSRSCRGTARSTSSRRTASTTAPTSGRCARSACARCWRRAPSAGCAPTSRRATSSSPTSWSTAPRAGPDVRRDRGRARAVRRSLLRPPVGRRGLGRRNRQDRRHDGGDRGAAVLDPRGVAALRRAGLVADQHDRAPRGRARPRDAAVLRRDRAGDRHGRRRRGRATASARRRSSRCSRRTSTGSGACWPGTIAALPDPDGCTCATWADGIDLTYEIP